MGSFEQTLFSVEATSSLHSSSLLLPSDLTLLEPTAEVLLASLARLEVVVPLAILGPIPPDLFFPLIFPPLFYSLSNFYLGQ